MKFIPHNNEQSSPVENYRGAYEYGAEEGITAACAAIKDGYGAFVYFRSVGALGVDLYHLNLPTGIDPIAGNVLCALSKNHPRTGDAIIRIIKSPVEKTLHDIMPTDGILNQQVYEEHIKRRGPTALLGSFESIWDWIDWDHIPLNMQLNLLYSADQATLFFGNLAFLRLPVKRIIVEGTDENNYARANGSFGVKQFIPRHAVSYDRETGMYWVQIFTFKGSELAYKYERSLINVVREKHGEDGALHIVGITSANPEGESEIVTRERLIEFTQNPKVASLAPVTICPPNEDRCRGSYLITGIDTTTGQLRLLRRGSNLTAITAFIMLNKLGVISKESAIQTPEGAPRLPNDMHFLAALWNAYQKNNPSLVKDVYNMGVEPKV